MVKFEESPRLFSVIFGEGIVNDAIAIILFETVKKLLESGEGIIFNYSFNLTWFLEFTYITPVKMIAQFLLLAFISICIGLVIAVAGCLMFKHMRFLSEKPSCEILITFLLAYSSYIFSF